MKTVLCNLIAIALLVYVLAVCISRHNIIHYNIIMIICVTIYHTV